MIKYFYFLSLLAALGCRSTLEVGSPGLFSMTENGNLYLGDTLLNSGSPSEGLAFINRDVVYRNIGGVLNVGNFQNQNGKKIVFKIGIDPKGSIPYAEYLENESTAVIKLDQKKKLIKEVMKYRYIPDESATSTLWGKLVVNFKNINEF